MVTAEWVVGWFTGGVILAGMVSILRAFMAP